MNLSFVIEVTLGGLLAGVMYSLVALGFVLIYKASGVFNYAQGSMVLFAALSFVGLLELGTPIWLAVLATVAIMVGLAHVVERLVLRPLVNQEQITLFMATIGLSFFLDGFGQQIWGSDVHTLNIGIPQNPIFLGDVLINQFDLIAAIVAASLVSALAVFFRYTRVGRALRAVADDHQAAQSVGIPLNRIWLLVWEVGGLVALVADVISGHKLGVELALSLIDPSPWQVVILGGFTS